MQFFPMFEELKRNGITLKKIKGGAWNGYLLFI